MSHGVVADALKTRDAALLRSVLTEHQQDASSLALLLNYAALSGNVDAVTVLLEFGADLARGEPSALFLAAERGNLPIVNLLLHSMREQKAAELRKLMDRVDSNGSPLFIAAQYGTAEHIEVMKVLLLAGFDVNQPKGGTGATPLFVATNNDHTEAMQLLLAHGAAVNAPNREGQTPLHTAARHGHTDALQILINAGASLAAVDRKRMTPLAEAAAGGRLPALRLLLALRPEVNTVSNQGFTPLHLAAQNGSATAVAALLEAGAAVNAAAPVGTALLMAVSRDRNAVLKVLLAHGADVTGTNGTVALHSVAARGNVKAMRLLLAAGASVEACLNGKTLIFAAANPSSGAAVAFLAALGVDANARASNGDTPLTHAVSRCDHALVVHALLDAGADRFMAHGTNGKLATQLTRDAAVRQLLSRPVKLD